jgi:hypothetical protein
VAIAARVIHDDLESLVGGGQVDPYKWLDEKETTFGSEAERVFGQSDLLARLSLSLASSGLAHILDDPYASARLGNEDRRNDILVAGYCRAEKHNIRPADLCNRPNVDFLPVGSIRLRYRKDGQFGESNAVLDAEDHQEVSLELRAADNAITVQTTAGDRNGLHDTLFGALHKALEQVEALDELALRKLNAWRLLGDKTSLETHRRKFLDVWAMAGESEAAVEQFWRTNGVEGSSPQPPWCRWINRPAIVPTADQNFGECATPRCLCHWLRTALIGGRYPAQAREVGRSYLGRLLGLREGVAMACSACGQRYLRQTSCACQSGHKRPAPLQETFHLQPEDGPTQKAFYHCPNHQRWCGVQLLPGIVTKPATGELLLPKATNLLGLDGGQVAPWLVDDTQVGWYLAPPPTWSRAHFTFFSRESETAAVLKLWWFPNRISEDNSLATVQEGTLVGTVELASAPQSARRPVPEGWKALDIRMIKQRDRQLSVTDPAQRLPRNPPGLADHRGRQALLVHLLDEGYYGISVANLGATTLHGTMTYDECGHHWLAGPDVSSICPRCHGQASGRCVMAFVEAPVPSAKRSPHRLKLPCGHELAHYQVLEKTSNSVKLNFVCKEFTHTFIETMDRRKYDGIFPEETASRANLPNPLA